jgi:fatty acid desaturase
MPDEIETQSSLATDSRHGRPSLTARPQPWILRNEKFVRAMCMVGAYVFGAIFLISLLAVGFLTLITLALAILFLASLALFLALWTIKRRR